RPDARLVEQCGTDLTHDRQHCLLELAALLGQLPDPGRRASQLSSGRPAGEQASRLSFLLLAEGCTLRLGAEIESCTAKRVAYRVAAHVEPLGKLGRGRPGFVLFDEELDDRAMERVLPGERAVARAPRRIACGAQKFGQFSGSPRLLAVVSQHPDGYTRKSL